MTAWLLRLPLSAEEEAHIGERDTLPLPFDGIPALSSISGLLQAKHLVKSLYPDDPPEAIMMRVDRFWKIYKELQPEDLIAVPLSDGLALAEINGRYRYEDGHHIPVTWRKAHLPLAKFRKHKAALDAPAPMSEITDKELRVALREQLPHGYNRFVKMKWLLVVFFALGLVHIVQQLIERH